MLAELAEALPLVLVVYIGEFSSSPHDEDAHAWAAWFARRSKCQSRQRRYVAVISWSAECGVGMILNGTGSGEPSRMYSMYSRDRTNFHSMSWSVCPTTYKHAVTQLKSSYR